MPEPEFHRCVTPLDPCRFGGLLYIISWSHYKPYVNNIASIFAGFLHMAKRDLFLRSKRSYLRFPENRKVNFTDCGALKNYKINSAPSATSVVYRTRNPENPRIRLHALGWLC